MRLTLGLAALLFVAAGCGYNTIQSMDEQAAAARQQIEVQLQRRADLVPNLVETVRGYARQEERIFTEVARARANVGSAIQSGDAAQMANANAQLTGALGRLIAVAENYPQLKSDQNFMRLQDELAGTENRIAVARTDYNDAVREYNAYIRRFPQTVTARVIDAEPREYFEVTDAAARQAPQVDFPEPPAPAGTAAPAAPPATGEAPPAPGGASPP